MAFNKRNLTRVDAHMVQSATSDYEYVLEDGEDITIAGYFDDTGLKAGDGVFALKFTVVDGEVTKLESSTEYWLEKQNGKLVAVLKA